jgi:hypothetical protein
MAQSITPVTGTATSASVFDDIIEALALKGDAATQGVVRGKLNALATTGAASPVATNTGWAIVNGKLYRNTASVNTNVASPAVSTRIDRLVVRIDYTASPETGVLTLIGGIEGGAAPAVTQVDGTTWDLPLYQVSITTGGVITLTDERAYIGDGHVVAASIAAGTITADRISNRTRYLSIPCTGGWNVTGDAELDRETADHLYGLPLADDIITDAFGYFYVPADYASSGVVIPIVYAGGTGNMYAGQVLYYGATGETPSSVATALTTQAMTNTKITACTSIQTAFGAITAGDYVMIVFRRDANTGATDTIEAENQMIGFLLSYEADS